MKILTGNHGKTDVKKAVNHAVIRKGMLIREFLWLCPTVSGSKLEYALNRIMLQPVDRQAFFEDNVQLKTVHVWSVVILANLHVIF